MKHTVKFKFKESEHDGKWGLVGRETEERYNDSDARFDPVWEGFMMFHDVFEHWHEHVHPYFRGEAAMNIGGEMAAMGAMVYYIEELGVSNRISWPTPQTNMELMTGTTSIEVINAISNGYSRYGSTLVCHVPRQRPIQCGDFEYELNEYWEKVKRTRIEADRDDEKELATIYKQSVTKAKILNLHRYGFRMAQKLVPDNWENRNTLIEFITYFDKLFKNLEAEYMMNYFSGLTIEVRVNKGKLKWWGVFDGLYGVDDLKIKPSYVPCEDDIMSLLPEWY